MGLRNKDLFHDKHIFFITTTCYKWLTLLLIGDGFTIISDSLNFCLKKLNASMLGYVLMPNHVHLIIHFVKGKDRIDFMRDFKKYTAMQIRKEVENKKPELLNTLRVNKQGQILKVWQDRYDEIYLENKKLFEIKLDYIHDNPMQKRWNLVERQYDYHHSSASFYEKGILMCRQVLPPDDN